MGSADWMPRNLDKRVEILFPVNDAVLKEDIKQILDVQLQDNVKAHILQADGTYDKIDRRGKAAVNSQSHFCDLAKKHAREKKQSETKQHTRRFEPMKSL